MIPVEHDDAHLQLRIKVLLREAVNLNEQTHGTLERTITELHMVLDNYRVRQDEQEERP